MKRDPRRPSWLQRKQPAHFRKQRIPSTNLERCNFVAGDFRDGGCVARRAATLLAGTAVALCFGLLQQLSHTHAGGWGGESHASTTRHRNRINHHQAFGRANDLTSSYLRTSWWSTSKVAPNALPHQRIRLSCYLKSVQRTYPRILPITPTSPLQPS